MAVFFCSNPARVTEQQANAAERVATFIRRHADGLWLLLEQSSDPAGIEALEGLLSLTNNPLRCPAAVHSALAAIISALYDMPHSAIERAEHVSRTTDPFAAYGWNLAPEVRQKIG